MSHYTMLSKYGNCTRLLKIRNNLNIDFFKQIKSGRVFDIVVGVFDKTIIPLALVGYEMIIANSLAIYMYHLISNEHPRNNCYIIHAIVFSLPFPRHFGCLHPLMRLRLFQEKSIRVLLHTGTYMFVDH